METLQSETLIAHSPNTDALLANAYGVMQHLGWTPKFAGPLRLIGFTPKKRFSYGEEIMAEVMEGGLVFSSKMNHETGAWNATKNDKKHIKAAQETLELIQKEETPEQQQQWQESVNQLREETNAILEEKKKLDEELETVMHISTGSRWVTLGLIGSNVLLFIIMAIAGAGIFNSDTNVLINWGANYAPHTLTGEWGRLITSMFIHIGVIHLLFNMYALFMIGNYLEPMLGAKTFSITYLCTGIVASLTSLWWHDTNLVAAGASGAIFGMYGVFLALLTTNLIPAKARKEMLTSIAVMVGYNLLYGMKDGIDNAAHVGGLLSGFLIGYGLYIGLKKPAFTMAFLVLLLVSTSIGTAIFLKTHKNDTLAYQAAVKRFYVLQDEAMKPFDLEDNARLAAIKTTTLPVWQNAKKEMEGTKALTLDKKQQALITLLNDYAELRIRETTLMVQYVEGNMQLENELEKVKAATVAKVEAINAFLK